MLYHLSTVMSGHSLFPSLTHFSNPFRPFPNTVYTKKIVGQILPRKRINMANANYSVLLHAGTTESWRAEPEFQEAAEQALYEMAQRAGSMLASGAKSIDVAEDVVTQLEDCPLFNAGKGAVLNEKGKHEVRQSSTFFWIVYADRTYSWKQAL